VATKTLADIVATGKTVLMRVDFNVPVREGKVTNDRRIVQALPSIRHVLEQGGKLVLMSHFGRPGETGFEAEFSLRPVAHRLSSLLGKPVTVGPQSVIGPELDQMVRSMATGDVILLENVRFHPGETMSDKAKNNPDKKLTAEQQKTHDDFVAAIAKLGDMYVNDAFGTCHRKHASMYGVAKAIQAKGGPAIAGFLVEKEIRYLNEAMVAPKRPFLAILGGAKVSDKIGLIDNLLAKVDGILIGGAMAYTLLKARGVQVGESRVEQEQIESMSVLLAKAGGKMLLPLDHVATGRFDPKTLEADVPVEVDDVNIPDNLLGMDLGGRTIAAYRKAIEQAGTIVWNGPMGVFELPEYATGTKAIAAAVAAATEKGTISVVGGGDSAAAVEPMGLDTKMTHVSTGGGASLEYLEGKPMPPIEVLDTR
jgi:3-phosphoglycerate kinase